MPPQLLKMLTTKDGAMLAFPRDRFVTVCLEVYGEFSPAEANLLAQIVRPGMTVVEVGANIGAHTLALARACRPGPLYAFEPQRRVFQVLCANLALNDIDNVVARPQACGAESGEAVIPALDYAAKENFGGVSLAPPDAAGERVEVVRLDDLRLEACGLIKADVEGWECEVLRGAAETIARLRPVLYVENDRPPRQRELIRLLDAMGYRLYWHTPALVRRNNFNGHEQMVFNRNYLSINVLGLPQERATKTDLEPIDPADPRTAAALDPERSPLPL